MDHDSIWMCRFDVQVDVLKQLGTRLEAQLKEQEADIAALPREQAARQRSTYIKLSRDFQRVEVTFKNLVLEVRRKRAKLDDQKRQALSATTANTTNATEEERIGLELQLQQEVSQERRTMHMQICHPLTIYIHLTLFEKQRLNEEIMREREEEIRSINRGMHQVNEIYKVRFCTFFVCALRLGARREKN